MAQVDAAGERDVALGCVRVPQDHQLLVVRSAAPDPLVEQHLAAGALDVVAEVRFSSSLYGELVQMRAPHQALDDDAALGAPANNSAIVGPSSRIRSSGSPRQSVKNRWSPAPQRLDLGHQRSK